MRVKSFLVSFLFVLSFSFLFAETVTLKTYPTIQTDPDRDMSEFLNAPNFKDILKAQKAEAKRKNDILK